MEISKESIGKLIIEGKTKRVFELNTRDNISGNDLVYVVSKDKITAGDGAKAHEMSGKSILSTRTNCALFQFLSGVGVNTHYVSRVSDNNPDSERAFVAKNCQMVPIEWVARRVATGSYLKRNPNVKEGYRFTPVKLETFFKDDANHDPYWSVESIIGAEMTLNGRLIGEVEVKEMLETTRLVFELLERVWQTVNHSLIDMKIEFGVLTNGEIVVADVIDNDSWRLWPNGEKRLMLDKQVYRNLDVKDIDQKAIDSIRGNFELVAQRTHKLFTSVLERRSTGTTPVVAILLGSVSDRAHAQTIATCLHEKYGIGGPEVEIHVCSAHKGTAKALDVVARISQWPSLKVIVACAGMSNGLGPVVAGNACAPVINCPPIASLEALSRDVWSSLRMPSGIGCSTALGAENAALAAALVVGNDCPYVWSRVRTLQTQTAIKLIRI